MPLDLSNVKKKNTTVNNSTHSGPSAQKLETLPQTKSAYQQNVSSVAAPIPQQWDTRTMLGRIATIGQRDQEKAQNMLTKLGALQSDPNSKYYNPYAQATNRAVSNLAALGFDTNNLNDNWWNQNQGWVASNLTYTGTTNSPSKPGKKATLDQQIAYELYQWNKSEETTKKAEQEWQALQDELSYWAKDTSRNYSDDQILQKIDWSKYKTLASMDENKYLSPTELNRSIGYSEDAMYGVMWAARNPDYQGDLWGAMANSALGTGNQYIENPDITARLNWHDKSTYSPYSVGMTLEQEGLYFGVPEFGETEINRLKNGLDPRTGEPLDQNDEMAMKMLDNVLKADEKTVTAEKELGSLNEKIDIWIEKGWSEEKILKRIESELDNSPTLREMDKSIYGSPDSLIGMTRAVNYKHDDIVNEVSRRVMERDLQGSSLEQTNKVTGNMVDNSSQNNIIASAGTSDITDQRYVENTKAKDETIKDSTSAVEDIMTPEETAHMDKAGSFSWDYMLKKWDTVRETINNMGKVRQEFADEQISKANSAYTTAAFNSSVIINEFERNSAQYSTLKEQENILHRMYGDLDYIGKTVPDETSVTIKIGDNTAELFFERQYVTDENGNEVPTYVYTGMTQVDIGAYYQPGQENYEFLGNKEDIDDRIKSCINSLNTYADKVTKANESGYVLTETDEKNLQEYYTVRAELEKASEYISNNQTAYDEAKRTEEKARNDLYRTYSILSKLGINTDGGKQHLQMIDHAQAYGDYKRTKHSYSDVNIIEESLKFSTFTDSEGNVNYPQTILNYYQDQKTETDEQIADLQYLIDYFGDDLPPAYLESYQKQIEELKWDSKEYEYALLRGNDDWTEMVEAGRAKDRRQLDQNSYMSESFLYWGTMTDEEREKYYYIYGRDGQQAAREYYDHLYDMDYGTLHKRETENIQAATRSMVEDSWFLANASSIISAPAASLASMLGLGYKALTGNDIGDTAFGWLNTIANTTQEETAQMIRDHFGEDTVAGKVIGGLYEIVWNRGRSMMNAAAFPGLGALNEFLGSVPMASTAMFDAMAKAEESGAEDWQIWTLGAVTFLCEAGTEMIELGHIKEAKELGLDSLSGIIQFFKQYPIEGLSEALGESLNDIIENAADLIVMGDESERAQRTWYYQTTLNMSKEDAEAMAIKDEIYGVLHTAIISFLSPGMDVLSFASGKLALYDHYRRETKQLQSQGYNVSIRDIRNAERNEARFQQEIENGPVEDDTDQWHVENPNVEITDIEDFNPVRPNQKEVAAQEKEYVVEMEVLDSLKGISDSAAKTAAVASVLKFGISDQNIDRANAAAVHVDEVFENGDEEIQDLMQGGLVAGVNLYTLKAGIQYAAIGGENSACYQVVQSEEYKSATPDVKAEMLAQAAVTDAQNQTVQNTVDAAVHENRVAEQEKILIANGALEGTLKAAEKAEEAAAENRQAQEDLEAKQGEAEAAAQALDAAVKEHNENPTDENAKQVISGTTELKQRDESVMQYEQHKAKLDAALEKAESALDETKNKEMTTVREQAEANVQAIDQQRAEAEAQRQAEIQAQQEEIARLKAEEDERTGKAQEVREDSAIEAALDSEGLEEGEERDSRRQALMDQRDKIKFSKVDLGGSVNNTEGYLAISALSRKLGIDIKFTEMPFAVRGKYENNVIYLNQNRIVDGSMSVGQALVEAALHEIPHSMENLKAYKAYRNVVLESMFGASGSSDAISLYNSNADFRAAIDQMIAERTAAGDNLGGDDQNTKIENAEKEIIADFARLNLAEKDVVQRFMDAGLGGQMRNTLHNINQALKNFFRIQDTSKIEKWNAEHPDNQISIDEYYKQAEYLRRAERAYQKAMNELAKTTVHPEGGQFSIMQVAQATGMRFDEKTMTLYDKDNNVIDGVNTKLKTSDVVQTPVGYLIRTGLNLFDGKNAEKASTEKGYIDPTSTAGKALDMMTGLMNMIARYKQSDLVWEIGASTLSSTFSALKSNSDTQYQTTVDFGTICAKTQAIIDVMSKVMMDKIDPKTGMLKEGMKPGLTRKEIMKVYDATHNAKLSVPCPVCYVFSRWMGVPSLLGQMSQFQKNYVVTKKDEKGNTIYDKKGDAVIDWAATKKVVNDYLFSTEEGKEGMLVKYKDKEAINDKKTKLQNKLKSLEEKQSNLEKQLRDPNTSEEQKAKIRTDIDGILNDMVDVEDQLGEVRAFNWVTQALCLQKRKGNSAINVTDENGHYVLDEKNFKITPDNILFDLNRTSEFAEYSKNWSYRNTRGAGMGKSIMPYSGETIGDMFYNGKGKRQNGLKNPWLNYVEGGKNGQAIKQLNDARKRAKQQNLLGGQRLQSTSDFRPEWGLDYIMSFLELQAAGSKVQMYTKVAEAVDFFASVGADVNLSIMGQGTGWHLATAEELAKMSDEEKSIRAVELGGKTYLMDFSGITGMKYYSANPDEKTATSLKNLYNNVQMILVGINDTHIRLAMANNNIDFIIPWHSSGNSKEVLSNLISSVGEKLETSVDYTTTQSDMKKGETKHYYDENGNKVEYSAPGVQTEQEKRLWDLRMRILTGKANNKVEKGGFTAEERAEVYKDKWLRQLYDRFYVKGVDDNCYGVKLSSKQAGQIFPYEYWATGLVLDEETGTYKHDPTQKGATKDTADENGKRFVEYCERMGIIPRFSQFKNDTGYWKLLIDRPMYNNDGTYHEQQTINVTNARVGNLDESGKLDKESTDLPTQAQAIYAPKDKRNPMYKEYAKREKNAVTAAEKELGISHTEKQDEALQDANALQDDVYRDGVDPKLSIYGDMTEADRQLLKDAETDYQRAMDNGDEQTAQEDLDYIRSTAGNDAALDTEYMDAVRRGDVEKQQKMVNARAEELKAEVFAATDVPAYRVRRDFTPKKTITVYKTFTLDDKGRPSALFVSSKNALPVGVWLDAQDTDHFVNNKNGNSYVVSVKNPNTQGGATGSSRPLSEFSTEDVERMEKLGLIKRNNKGELPKNATFLAYRPGWHAGDLPFFPQGGMKIEGSNYENVHRYNQVVFECEMAADEDYTTYTTTKDGELKYKDRQEMPVNGSYKFATNPMANAEDIGAWFISGALKINRALTEEECNKILGENGYDVQEWQAYQDPAEKKASGDEYAYEHSIGPLDLDALGYDPTQTDGGKKLLDPITYDDNGNVIPLSQRFDASKNDPRYSVEGVLTEADRDLMREKDEEYLASVKLGYFGSAERMVDEAAKEAGYTIKAYHGTPNGKFNTFLKSKVGTSTDFGKLGRGFYFTSKKQVADYYAGYLNSSTVMPVYLKMDNPFVLGRNYDNMSVRELYDSILGEGGIVDEERSEELTQWLIDNGYDGIIADGEYMVLDPKNIKSADTVTYDKYGDPIPLSERFRTDHEEDWKDTDIRYSEEGEMTDADRELARQNELNQTLLNAGVVTQEDIDAYNGNLPGRPTMEGGAYRQFGRFTAQEGNALHNDVKEYLYNHSAYTPETNQQQIDRAIDWVRGYANNADTDGFFGAMQAAQRGDFDSISADGQARMLTLMGMAALKGEETGDHSAELLLADMFNKQGTEAGRALQARKMFRLMTPVGRMAALNQMADQINEEYGKKGIRDKNGNQRKVALSEWTLLAAGAAESEEDFQKVRKAAARELAEQMPANWKEKLQAWRMLAMLGNVRTHVRNVVGNAIFMPAVGLKNKIGAGLEAAFIKEGDRTKTLGIASKDARDFAKADVKEMESVLRGESKYNEGNAVQQERKMFGQGNGIISKTLGRSLQWLVDLNGKALEGEDWIFLNRHYRNALAGYMTANNLTADDMKGNTLDNARAYAVNEAQKATYRDANEIANWMNSVKNPVAKFLINAVVPFKKTPANILKRGVEYSPVSIIKSLSSDIYHLKQWNAYQNGELSVLPSKAISPTQYIDRLSSGLSGTAIMALGALLSSLGVIKAGMDDDEDEFEKLQGSQEYSIEIGGVSFTLDWAAPICMPFFVGATIMDEIMNDAEGENKGIDIGKILDSIIGITEPVFNLSMLEGVNNLFNTSQYSEGNNITQSGLKIIANYATSFVPTFVGQVARTIDTTRRKAYTPSGASIWEKVFGNALETVENKIPYLSQTNIPYRDVWGEADVSPQGWAAIENFISPGYGNRLKNDPVTRELQRIYNETGDPNMIPKAASKTVSIGGNTVKLNAEQYDQYVVDRGQTAKQCLSELMESPIWQICDDNTRAMMISDSWTYANQIARHNLDQNGKKDSWVANAEYNGNFIDTVVERAAESNRKDYIAGYGQTMAEALDSDDTEMYELSLAALEGAEAKESEIRGSLRDYFKPLYQQAFETGDEETMDEIEWKLLDADVGFKEKDFNSWIPSEDEEDEEEVDKRWLNENNYNR